MSSLQNLPAQNWFIIKKNDELTHLLTSEVRPKLFFPVLLRHVVNEVMLRIAFFPLKET